MTAPDDPVLATVPEGYTWTRSGTKHDGSSCRASCERCGFWCASGDWERDRCKQQLADYLSGFDIIHAVRSVDGNGRSTTRGCALS